MTEVQHTPGPWVVRIDHDGQSCGPDDGPLVEVVGQDGEVVCCNERYYPTRLDQKNARLIAASPELLEALSGILESEWMVTHDWGGDRDKVLEAGYAAYRKATGKEPTQ